MRFNLTDFICPRDKTFKEIYLVPIPGWIFSFFIVEHLCWETIKYLMKEIPTFYFRDIHSIKEEPATIKEYFR